MAKTKVEWADMVWNPITGCTPVSEGCRNCYAKRMAQRMRGRCGYPKDDPFRPGTFHEDKLLEPMTRHKPRRFFVCSMGDLFHESVGWVTLDQIFAVMAVCQTHTFLVLTKRPVAMRSYMKSMDSEEWANRWRSVLADLGVYDKRRGHIVPPHGARRSLREKPTWPPRNVWLGVSVEDQQTADERIPILLQTPAAVRFVSCEPLLGPVDLGRWRPPFTDCDHWGVGRCTRPENPFVGVGSCRPENCVFGRRGLDWVIVGGETGPGARPMHPDWARSLRNQCQEAGVPFFFKQQGEWGFAGANATHALSLRGELKPLSPLDDAKGWWPCARVGKRAAGRLLDGREWNQWPGEA